MLDVLLCAARQLACGKVFKMKQILFFFSCGVTEHKSALIPQASVHFIFVDFLRNLLLVNEHTVGLNGNIHYYINCSGIASGSKSRKMVSHMCG